MPFKSDDTTDRKGSNSSKQLSELMHVPGIEILGPLPPEIQSVTVFTAGAQETLPIFILDNIERGQQLPIVNVVAFFVIVVTIIPVALAQRVMRDTGVIRRGAGQVTEAVEAAEIPAA